MIDLNELYVVPRSFMLFSSKVNVVFENSLMNNKSRYGESSYSELKIRLSNTCGVDNLPGDRVRDCFYHEKVHMILNSMGEHDLSNNEKFVDVFAKLLRQSELTAEY